MLTLPVKWYFAIACTHVFVFFVFNVFSDCYRYRFARMFYCERSVLVLHQLPYMQLF